ncbi:MAG: ATP-binding sensor histidine kinase [Candidatus Scalindua sp.]
MTKISDYITIEQLYEGVHSNVFRARKDGDNKTVILKILKDEFPTENDIYKFRREFEIGNDFSDSLIVKYISIEPHHHGLAIIEEDNGAVSLKNIIPKNGFSPEIFLRIAIQIAEGVNVIHRKNIIHRVITPHHIIINIETNTVKFIDFGISSPLDQEIQQAVSPATLGLNLAYISPEQTGRMNRIMDYRTDFYSVGVTFYELLTGRLPFDEEEALALIHCHIAKTPMSPHEIKSDIPSAISDIIMKLMAKNAEGRYQSANGLKMDLEECLVQLERKRVIEDFTTGQNDLSDRFHIQQKLYGRDEEIKQLLNSFDQVCNGNVRSTLMLVYGYSGIGKSSLINEVHKSLVREKGYFISGKYDQFKRNIPYSSFIQAFQGLMKQILAEDDESIARWKAKIIDVLGENAQVIIDVIPEVEMIIGPQPPVTRLGAVENQNRFNRVFQNFSSVFSKREHPLVIFLDDLQWADLPTMNLMELMMTNTDFQYLFFIGAYRDNEVDVSHPLTGILNDIEKKNPIEKIALGPLALSHVNCLISDSVNCTLDISRPLAELVNAKTLGNPFFAIMFLKMLHQEKLIEFDFRQRRWTWDVQKIEAMDITDNVIDLMVTRILKLPKDSQRLLSLASCIGNQFDLKTLSLVYGASVVDTYRKFWIAVKQGLILPIEVEYKWMEYVREEDQNARFRFLHDRVQQAAYSLIAEEERPGLHLEMGRLFLNDMSENELEENIFEVVNHFNEGRALISDRQEREQLAGLNLRAVKKAKLSSAYEPALNYVTVGMEYLTENSWEENYNVTLSYYIEKGELEYLNSNWDMAIATFDEALGHAGSLLDRCEINEYKSTLYRMKNDLKTALNIAVQALGELGIFVRAFPDEAETMKEVEQARDMVADKDIEDLFNLTELTNPESLAAMRLLRECFGPAYFLGSRLTSIIGIRMTEITIKHGNCSHSAAGYIFLSAITLAADLGDFDDAYKFGSLALRLNDQRYHEKAYEALILDMWGTFVCHYKEPIKIARDHLMRGYYSGVENGSYQWAGYCAMISLFMTFWGDNTLNEVSEKIEKVLPGLEKVDPNMAQYYYAVKATVFNLKEPVKEKIVLYETVWPNINKVLKVSHEQDDMLTLLVDTTCRLSLANWYFDYEKAIEYAEIGEKYATGSPGVFLNPVFKFHQCLAYTSAYEHVDEQKKSEYLVKIRSNLSRLEHRAAHSPTTYMHQAQLVKAELARIESNVQEGMDLYDQAIESAQVNGFLQNEALANEMAGRFWLSMGKNKFADAYFRDACYCYRHWGAVQKAEDIENKYSGLLEQHQIRDSSITTDAARTIAITGSKGLDVLDVTTVIKISQTISSEIDLKKLLSTIMEIIIENAGAQNGFLILKRDGQLYVEATVDSVSGKIEVLQSIPIDRSQHLSQAIVRYVMHTGENVVLHDAAMEGMFVDDSYISKNQPKSILCMPIHHKNKISGILYLENNLISSAFIRDRIETLHILLVQTAISLENARLYSELKQEISVRKKAEEEITRHQEHLEDLVDERTKELRDSQRDLISAERFAVLGKLSGGIAHEIRNPLSVIDSSAYYLSRKLKDADKKTKEHLGRISRQIKITTEIIQGLQDLTKMEEPNRTRLDVARIIEEGIMLSDISQNVKLVKQVPKNNHFVYVDGKQLSIVFRNVLTNAMQAMNHKGTIYINVNEAENNGVNVTIEDTGPGIKPEDLGKIFHSFFGTKTSGFGFGLTICQMIMEKNGGKIEAQSKLGKGANFIIRLPSADTEKV